MATQKEVDFFLKEFKIKMKVWDIIFRNDRDKNIQTLSELEISPKSREDILYALLPSDYSNGPIKDVLNKGNDMWIFGREVKKHKIFIKIQMGLPGSSDICISFHFAENTMNYPLKQPTS